MRELLQDDGFRIALVVALMLSGAIGLVHRRRDLRLLTFEAGAASAIAALVALFATHRRAMLSLLGLALVVLGTMIGRFLPRWWIVIATVPGAALIALALHAPIPDWAAVVCFGAIVVVAPCAVAVDGAAPRLLPALLAITALGMWGTTPDTEHTRVIVGALVGIVVLAFDRRLESGAGGTAAIVSLMVWAATIDGHARHSAVVGALGCFGAIVLLPLVGRARVPASTVRIAAVIAIQAVIVVVCSRVAGLRDSAGASLAICAVTWVFAGGVLRLVMRPSGG
jgi:hypothetical protein